MSLDVYLKLPNVPARTGSGIFVREAGATRQLTREEWDARYPGREPFVVTEDGFDGTVYDANITHNLNRMAQAAGLYEALWRPDEIGITKARQLIEPLTVGLAVLRVQPERFRAFNPENGWGTYEGLVDFVTRYLAACEEYPEAAVSVSR